MVKQGWKQLDSQRYSEFRAALLRDKGDTEQRKFLNAVRDRNEFLELMDRIPTIGTRTVPILPTRLTEDEFQNPPASAEERLYQEWKNLTPAIASSPAFWASVTLDHIRSHDQNRQPIIDASYLAGNDLAGQSSLERIDRALKATGDKASKQIDDCVRTIFRQLGGLPQARGNKSVYVDCPLARAWWRERLILRAKNHTQLSARTIGLAIRKTKSHWEQVVVAMVSRNPILGMAHAQDALILSLASIFNSPPSPHVRQAYDRIQKICQRLCFIGASKEFGVLDFSEIRNIADEIVAATP